jgi:hypothetical protein
MNGNRRSGALSGWARRRITQCQEPQTGVPRPHAIPPSKAELGRQIGKRD